MIKNLIFDFGKVLVDYDISIIANKFFSEPEQMKLFQQLLSRPEAVAEMDREEIPFSQYVARLQAQYPAIAQSLQHFHDDYNMLITGEMPGMKDLLTRLKAKGYHLYGLTNWCSKVHNTIEKYSDLFGLLDGRIISSEVHFIKPEPEIYHALLDTYRLVPEECVFADDKPENIAAAQALGIHGIVFVDACQYARELSERFNIEL